MARSSFALVLALQAWPGLTYRHPVSLAETSSGAEDMSEQGAMSTVNATGGCAHPSKEADTCDSWGYCACCDGITSTCLKAKHCKKEEGKTCAEATWKPTLAELQSAFAARGEGGTHQLEKRGDLRTAEQCLAQGCGMSICAKKRGLLGTAVAVHLGRSAAVRELAAGARAWHWNPGYKQSPYLSKAKVAVMSTFSDKLKMSRADCEGAAGGCCAAGDGWQELLAKLTVLTEAGAWDPSKARRRFTYAITAPQDSNDIEWRVAKMEGARGGTTFHDPVSKHAWLAGMLDWVLYAGELWVQPRPGASEPVGLAELLIVLDTNSGTFAPGADYETRRRIKSMLTAGLGLQEANVAVCPGPFNIQSEAKAGRSPEGLVAQDGDACPQLKELYPDEFP